MGEVKHNNRAFDDLVAEMSRDHPSEMALAGEWAAGWADGVKHGAAQIDALRAERADLVATLVGAQKIINHQGWSANEQPAYDAIEAALAKPPVQAEPVVFWALYDATADVPYFKKMMPENCLAIFDSEAEAMRAKAGNKGTDYKGVYITSKPPAAQANAEPVGWYTEDHLTDKSATTYDKSVADRWRAKGWPVYALYAAPQSVSDVAHTII